MFMIPILVYPGVKHSVSLLSSRDECSVTEWVTPGLPRMHDSMNRPNFEFIALIYLHFILSVKYQF